MEEHEIHEKQNPKNQHTLVLISFKDISSASKALFRLDSCKYVEKENVKKKKKFEMENY